MTASVSCHAIRGSDFVEEDGFVSEVTRSIVSVGTSYPGHAESHVEVSLADDCRFKRPLKRHDRHIVSDRQRRICFLTMELVIPTREGLQASG